MRSLVAGAVLCAFLLANVAEATPGRTLVLVAAGDGASALNNELRNALLEHVTKRGRVPVLAANERCEDETCLREQMLRAGATEALQVVMGALAGRRLLLLREIHGADPANERSLTLDTKADAAAALRAELGVMAPSPAPASVPAADPDPAADPAAAGVILPSFEAAPQDAEVPWYRTWWFWLALGLGMIAATAAVLETTSGEDGSPATTRVNIIGPDPTTAEGAP